jgi:type VII secretion integral membrane protein EccD
MKGLSPGARIWAVNENTTGPALNGHDGHSGASMASAVSHSVVTEGIAASEHVQAASQAAAPHGVVDDLCRLTVCGPSRTVELAVPVHVPLIDLLPALLGHLGENLADTGLEHEGWVLQRLGDPPMREELSVAALGLRDGDMVNLRPRSNQLPQMDFDDLIDGIAVGISRRHDRWRPDMSRCLLAGLLGGALAVGLTVLAGHVGTTSALLAAGMTAVLLGLTAAASRAFADVPATVVLGVATIAYAGVGGVELPLLNFGSHGSSLLAWAALRAALLAGGVAIAGASAAVAMVSGGRQPTLAGAVTAGLLIAAGGAAATAFKLGPAAVAAVIVTLAVPVGACVPILSFRLTKMRLDPTPTSADELQADLDPIPGEYVLERTRLADRYMTALYGGLGVVVGACLVALGISGGVRAEAVAADAIVLLLLHSRGLVAARHRLAAVIPAAGGAAVLLAAAGLRVDARLWPAVLVVVVVVAAALFTAERSLPGHKLLPYWGRIGDVLHTLSAAALLPLTLWLLNVYQFVKSAHG